MKKLSSQSKQLLKETARGILVALAMLAAVTAVSLGFQSCKAWRTVTTTATYVQQNDTAKSTATITTKTVEEYQGVKKK